MAIKLNDLERWTLLEKGHAIQLPAKLNRRVRLLVNTSDPVNLYCCFESGEERFLAALVAGLETVEFVAFGNLAISAEFGALPDDYHPEVWFQTAEHEATSIALPENVSYTRAAVRKVRNPEFEMMEFVMRQNMEARFAQMSAQHQRDLEAATRKVQADEKATVHVPPAAEHPKSDGAKLEGGGTGEAAPTPTSSGADDNKPPKGGGASE